MKAMLLHSVRAASAVRLSTLAVITVDPEAHDEWPPSPIIHSTPASYAAPQAAIADPITVH